MENVVDCLGSSLVDNSSESDENEHDSSLDLEAVEDSTLDDEVDANISIIALEIAIVETKVTIA